MASETREKRRFWAVKDGKVRNVEGLSCGPENPDYWWVPSLGLSMCVGFHLFDSRPEAVARATTELRTTIRQCENKLTALDDTTPPASDGASVMGRWRKKPVVVEAVQWFKSGDHPEDDCELYHTKESGDFLGEGKVVRYYRHPDVPGSRLCEHCGKTMHEHGWIDTLEGGHVVCPGDWIITGVKGERYPCKPDVFAETYEPADSTPASPAPVEPRARWLFQNDPYFNRAVRMLQQAQGREEFATIAAALWDRPREDSEK